jgi:hypothetical protein
MSDPRPARLVYSVTHGDIWVPPDCDACRWPAGHKPLPFPTRAAAEHFADMHKVLCELTRG